MLVARCTRKPQTLTWTASSFVPLAFRHLSGLRVCCQGQSHSWICVQCADLHGLPWGILPAVAVRVLSRLPLAVQGDVFTEVERRGGQLSEAETVRQVRASGWAPEVSCKLEDAM